MSSLWTPEGERPVGRGAPAAGTSGAGGGGAPADAVGDDDEFTAEEQAALAAQMGEIREQLLRTPAAIVVANHAYGLFELAAIHLSEQPPNLEEARLAVDGLGALVEGLGDRLGEAEQPLRDALAQIRLAFVQISGVAAAPAPGPAEGGAAGPG